MSDRHAQSIQCSGERKVERMTTEQLEALGYNAEAIRLILELIKGIEK